MGNDVRRVANPKAIQACDLMRQVLMGQLVAKGALADQMKRDGGGWLHSGQRAALQQAIALGAKALGVPAIL